MISKSTHLEKEDGRPPVPPVRPCIDLHFHSYYSNDAFGDPARYVAIAEECGVQAIAPTEHDNLDSLPAYHTAIQKQGVRLALYSGVEIDVFSKRWGHLHVLAYFFDSRDPGLNEILQREVAGGMRQLRAVVEKMNAAGERIDLDAAFALYREEVPARAVGPKAVWKWLERTGRQPSYKAAQAIYAQYARQTPVQYQSSDLESVLSVVQQAGGVVVLAHPAKMRFTEADVEQALAMGMVGVEVFTPSNLDQVPYWEAVARRKGWVRSGGSDNHAPVEPAWGGWPTCAPMACLEELAGIYEKRFGRAPAPLIGPAIS